MQEVGQVNRVQVSLIRAGQPITEEGTEQRKDVTDTTTKNKPVCEDYDTGRQPAQKFSFDSRARGLQSSF